MDIEERKLLPNVLDLMEGVTPHFSQLAVGQKAASEVCVHSLTKK